MPDYPSWNALDKATLGLGTHHLSIIKKITTWPNLPSCYSDCSLDHFTWAENSQQQCRTPYHSLRRKHTKNLRFPPCLENCRSQYLQPSHIKSCIHFVVIAFSLGMMWQCLINKRSYLRKDVKDWRCLRCITKSIFKEVTSGDSLKWITAFSSSMAKHNNCRAKKITESKQRKRGSLKIFIWF